MVHVIATLELAPGARERFIAEFRRVMPLVHAEPGCIAYLPAVDAQTGLASQHKLGPDCVTIIETWASVDALRAHDAAAHMLEYRRRVQDIVVAREIRMLAPA